MVGRGAVVSVHRIAAISFRAAVLDCTCGAEVRGDAGGKRSDHQGAGWAEAGTPDALAAAFSAHRSAAGASSKSAGQLRAAHGPGFVISARHQRAAS